MKDEDIDNERAKLGIPAFALMHDRSAMAEKEGFDSHGHFWYQTYSSRMEPVIHQFAYLALELLSSVNDATSLNGEVYVFVICHSGTTETVIGRVASNEESADSIKVFMLNPKTTLEIKKKLIVETYLITHVMEDMPTSGKH